jgi:hypothetical protein
MIEIQKNFLKLKEIFQRNFSQKNFLEPYGVNVYKNLTAGVTSIAKKAKEVEEDARRRFCDYPSA